MDCPHLIPDENGNCSECGTAIPNMEAPNLGDIVGICKLLDATAAAFTVLIRENTDPQDPSRPRMRLVGGQIVRISHAALLKDLVRNSYPRVKRLGYRGSIRRWGELILENQSVTAESF